MTRRKLTAGILIAVAAAIVPAAASPNATVRASDREGFSTFREDSDRLTVFVDGYPASVAPRESYLPVPVAIAMTGPGRPMTLTPESFELVDARGNVVPAATYQEVAAKYDRLVADRSLIRRRPIAVPLTITDLHRVAANFYPPGNAGTRTAQVELARSTWFADVLYFPAPPGGVQGVMTLRVQVPDGKPVEVRFVANEKGLAASTD
jgi:hypothetical protein